MASGTSRSPLYAVSGMTSDDVYAVGSAILHYDGTAWSEVAISPTYSLRGLWGMSSSDMYAVGYHSVILRGTR